MRRKILLYITVLCVAVPNLIAQSEYDRVAAKAQRFFDYQEWASASAMYLLMMEERPQVPDTYAKAIVSNIMNNDTVQALNLVPRAMNYQVPVDSILVKVRDVSFSIGRGKLYENFLLDFKNKYSWFSRVADNYLMQYYALRQNGPELIHYAEIMLKGLPDDRNFLRMLAHGQLLDGKTDAAINTWARVVALYPDDYDTVLDLANCYDALGNNAAALKWMRRADSLRVTPYVTKRIAALSEAQAGKTNK